MAPTPTRLSVPQVCESRSTVVSPLLSAAVQTGSSPLFPPSTPSGMDPNAVPIDALNLPRDKKSHQKHGRNRNPVPSNLQGKADVRREDFGVMRMHLSEVAGGAAAAKRTSEATELAARQARRDRYIPLRRTRLVHIGSEPATPTADQHRPIVNLFPSPGLQATAPDREDQGEHTTATTSKPSHHLDPTNALAVKTEQDRLLVLLRSLPPTLVVDQICNAIAFFGGIPGASPPEDGAFPESAELNGSGSLFVRWISEIFPNLERPSEDRSRSSGLPIQDSQLSPDRPRVRPRGSKGLSPRRGESRIEPTTTLHVESDVVPDLSVTTPGNAGIADMYNVTCGDVAVESTALQGANNRAVALTVVGTAAGVPHTSRVDGRNPVRPRGRPKGSKNRPKGEVRGETLQQPNSDQAGSSGPQNSTGAGPVVPPLRKAGRGRPKGSKNKPKAARVPELQAVGLTQRSERPSPGGKSGLAPTNSRLVGPNRSTDEMGGEAATQSLAHTTARQSELREYLASNEPVKGSRMKRKTAASNDAGEAIPASYFPLGNRGGAASSMDRFDRPWPSNKRRRTSREQST